MSPSPTISAMVRIRRSVPVIALLSALICLVFLTLLAGCGGGKKDDPVLATVGGVEIKSSYYEDRLVKLEPNELPRGDDGKTLDMSLEEGKKKFLDILINKEVMVQTAKDMGMQNDPGIMTANESLTSYEASLELWDRVIQEPANTISPEELEAFYEKMGSTRKCLYVITNFLEGAENARQMALDGADWDDVVSRYHEGGAPPNGLYEITVPFGRYNPEYEDGVFKTEIGGITPVINTVYGYWVLKVLGEKSGKKPPLEEAKAQILDTTHLRKMSHLKDEFKKTVMEKYQLTIHEDALLKAFQGLPAGETLFEEGSQKPRAQEELSPLNIATEDMDLPFYSYVDPEGVKKEYTLLDYKIRYDRMSVFQRPKDSELLGGMRNKIQMELEKTLLNFYAEDMGLFEDPAVRGVVDIKIEEMIVSKLYSEVVVIDDKVTADDLDTFWTEHADEYIARENRTGRLVIALNADQAAAARVQIIEGAEWRDILVNFGTDRENKSKSGKVEGIIFQDGEPVSTALFALEPGDVSEPFAMAEGRYGVVKLDSVTPSRSREMIEVTEVLGQRIREIRKETAFKAMLEKWKENIPVVIHEKNLADLPSWEELKTVELPENIVPRN